MSVVGHDAPVLDALIGQPRVVQLLKACLAAPVHAYLFVGPSGSGKSDAARHFAAALVCPFGGCGVCPDCREALAGHHPDVVSVERSGASILVKDAQDVVALAQRTPRSASRQVIVLNDFHLVDEAAPMLLKTIEEPPDTTMFIVLADVLAPELVTIASRCLVVEFSALTTSAVEDILVSEGVEHDVAASAAAASAGSIDRARLLAGDVGFGARLALWRSVPDRLDGSGATVVVVTKELLASCDEIVEVLRARQQREFEEATAAAERSGLRAIPGRQSMEDRHRREVRRVRTDELRAGLAALAEAYRSRLVVADLPARRADGLAKAIERIDEIATNLVRNPNEQLLLEALLLELDGAR